MSLAACAITFLSPFFENCFELSLARRAAWRAWSKFQLFRSQFIFLGENQFENFFHAFFIKLPVDVSDGRRWKCSGVMRFSFWVSLPSFKGFIILSLTKRYLLFFLTKICRWFPWTFFLFKYLHSFFSCSYWLWKRKVLVFLATLFEKHLFLLFANTHIKYFSFFSFSFVWVFTADGKKTKMKISKQNVFVWRGVFGRARQSESKSKSKSESSLWLFSVVFFRQITWESRNSFSLARLKRKTSLTKRKT